MKRMVISHDFEPEHEPARGGGAWGVCVRGYSALSVCLREGSARGGRARGGVGEGEPTSNEALVVLTLYHIKKTSINIFWFA